VNERICDRVSALHSTQWHSVLCGTQVQESDDALGCTVGLLSVRLDRFSFFAGLMLVTNRQTDHSTSVANSNRLRMMYIVVRGLTVIIKFA